MVMETESFAFAAKLYTRAKPVDRWGAVQSRVVSESVNCASNAIGATMHGCTMNSTGTRPGLPTAFSADTTTVSRYTPIGRPAGLNASRSLAGAVPLVGPSNATHDPPIASRALHDRVPDPVLVTTTLSPPMPVLPRAAESFTWPGASERVARGGGVLVSLSTWQVASRNRRGTRATMRHVPPSGPLFVALEPPTASP